MKFVKRLAFWDASWDNRGGQVVPIVNGPVVKSKSPIVER